MSDTQPPQRSDAAKLLKVAQTLAGEEPRRVTSTDLLGAGRELVIEHGGREYRLRLTQNGKLILTA